MTHNNWIDIHTENTYPLSHFVIPTHYQEDLENVLIPYGLIQDRVAKLAESIASESTDNTPLVACCVLKGAHVFFAHLTEQLKKMKTKSGKSIPLSFEFIKVKSYENDQSTGSVSVSLSEEDLKSFQGKDLLIVEDIIDSGLTMVALLNKLNQYKPASIKVVSLLLKRTERRTNKYVPDHVGFSIPDAFVVGYALDYNEHFRDLDHICVINENGKVKYAQK